MRLYLHFQNDPADDWIKFIGFLNYLLCILVQVFLISFLGSNLSAESDGITYAIFESQWNDRNQKCKRAMNILVARSMQPMVICAGGVFELSLPTFVRVSQFGRIFLSDRNC